MMIVAYFYDGIPGGIPDPQLFTSLAKVRDAFREFIDSPCVTTEASAAIYYADAQMVIDAIYCKVGCPFDYPDFVLGIGPRGGIKQERT